MKNLLRAAAATVAAVLFLSGAVSAAPAVSARSAILVDAGSGRVLYEKDADQQSLIASTTKIMTCLLAAEAGGLDREIRIPAEAVGIEGSSLYLREGEVLTVEQLLYGMMLRSGNDAAVALAIAVSGSVEQFVAQMNQKAAELGLASTHFANPNGLDDEGNYSTARDLAKLSCYAMENPVFHQVVSTKAYAFGERSLTNHNKLLWRYEGTVGIKTGYTKAAGRILVSAAERDGRRLVAVTINAPYDWADHAGLLDYGFSSFSLRVFGEAGESLGSVPLVNGTSVLGQCRLRDTLAWPALPDEDVTLRICLPRFAFAPIREGNSAGCAQLLSGGRVVCQVELEWAASCGTAPVERKSLLERLLGG